MGKNFFNEKLNVNNALEIDLNIDELKELEIIKSSYLWGTNKDIFSSDKFSTVKPAWGGDMEWISPNNISTYNSFLKGFELLGLNRKLNEFIEYENQIRLYAGFFLKRSSSKKNFHIDWNSKLRNNAFTLLTPLYQEEEALHLLYHDIAGTECKYQYKIGKGIVFGSNFLHSTESGKSCSPSILLCFQFGTDLPMYNQLILDQMGAQTPFMFLPSGRCINHNIDDEEINTYPVPWALGDFKN